MGSDPMKESRSPMPPRKIPFRISPPEASARRDRAITAIAKYSGGPSFNASRINKGEIDTSEIQPRIPPTKEPNVEIPIATPACPFCVIGYPSQHEARE